MLFFSIGLPTRFAAWCDALMTQLVARGLGPTEALVANTPDELMVGLIRSAASHVIVCARQPATRLQSELVQSGRPFLVVIGDPRSAFRELRDSGGLSLAEATRAIASSCAMMRNLTTAPNALVVSECLAADPLQIAGAIADHLVIPLGTEIISDIVAALGVPGLLTDSRAGGDWQEGLDERTRLVLNGALQPYLEHLSTGTDLAPLIWEPELFYVNEEPPSPTPVSASGPIEITGRIRHLVYGPFITLPPGSWMADVVLGFTAEAAGMGFIVEIFAGSQLAQARIEVTGEQVSEITLHFVVDGSVGEPVQVRIVNERAAFDGRLAIGNVKMTPQTAVSDETRMRLANVLRQ